MTNKRIGRNPYFPYSLPFLLWQALVFVIPLFFLIVISFWEIREYRLIPVFTFQNYSELLSAWQFYLVIGRSLFFSFMVALSTIIFGAAIAYGLVFFVKSKVRSLILALIIISFLSNNILRAFGWQIIFAGSILFSPVAMIVGYISQLLPISVVIFSWRLANIDRDLIQAAANLGGSEKIRFLKIILPLSSSYFLASFAITFYLSLFDPIIATVVGGGKIYTFSLFVMDMLKIDNWPIAASASVIVMLITLIPLFVFWKYVARKETYA
ncbi:hypothetical protein COT82_00690 [Candidatus Campbellbacteria bacterium CG10_big_fil_rev_8_21_14_0_10_35_52]|uniref:ABC transmembrane type-1 domain-containing protein n=1 Tax=Candidatus Campbellbacteria bacterium CG10_big_fil_rev_8_21_14_0_10_35_52 TaxID=1974527 RepID=A0A2M6WVT9_9BACT|nr:MAG: hypothetical protein COT82_00690 [Candidatus Campbellbacteria bacterium CG10_big_fil_rev_8_21_14_0_10_35_52]